MSKVPKKKLKTLCDSPSMGLAVGDFESLQALPELGVPARAKDQRQPAQQRWSRFSVVLNDSADPGFVGGSGPGYGCQGFRGLGNGTISRSEGRRRCWRALCAYAGGD